MVSGKIASYPLTDYFVIESKGVRKAARNNLMAFDDLKIGQRDLIWELLAEQTSGKYSPECYAADMTGKGWSIQLKGIDGNEDKEISGFTEGDLMGLEIRGYLIATLKQSRHALSLSQKAFEQLHLSEAASRLQSPNPTKSSHTGTQNKENNIDIFISHSSKDKDVAEALINLLRAALNIPADRIRCTSVDGYKLPAGASTDEQLRQEIYYAKAFLGLITPTSLQSTYVLFELGARWGAHLHLAPVLASGAEASILRGPLMGFNALSCDVKAQVYQLVDNTASILKVNVSSPSVYQNHINALVEQSRQHREQTQSEELAVRTVVSSFSDVERAEIQRINKIITKLEKNLDLMRSALNFIDKLSDEDLTSKSGNLKATGSFRGVMHPLTAFLACEGDEDKLKNYTHELVEIISHNAKGGIGVDINTYIHFGNYSSPLTDFNPEADKIFKEVDAQLGIICKTLSLRFPGSRTGDYGGQAEVSSENWKRSNLTEAMNILNAARTITE